MLGGEGDTPSTHGGGYPIQSWWGVPWVSPHHPDLARGYPGYLLPIHSWWGVPHPVMVVGGTQSSHGRGIPHTVMVVGGTPSCHGRGVPWVPSPPTIQTWDGVPLPTIQTWDGVTPLPSRPGMGYPPTQTWDGVPPNQW